MDVDNIHKREKIASKSGDVGYFVEEMAKREYSHLKEASRIDEKILLLQKSTKVLIPQFSFFHNFLRMKYRWYYHWHLRKNSQVIHYVILTIFIILVSTLVLNSYLNK